MRSLLVLLALLGSALAPHPVQESPLEQLRWMSGCWQAGSGNHLVEEQWMEPRGGSLLGMSRTTRGDSTVAHEVMRIFERGGRPVFFVHPSGQAPTEFTASEVEAGSIVFANPQHDFPQRILYRRVGADSLVARIEGTRSGRTRGVDFRYARVSCPGG
ncbi:MAG TPA: DUF6265 family protein [Longimicrobiaceae bacterium]|nr:DUF6265 family protein [Longimicrobiaceae bacterium]